jgi:hypothetical protein
MPTFVKGQYTSGNEATRLENIWTSFEPASGGHWPLEFTDSIAGKWIGIMKQRWNRPDPISGLGG